MDKRDSFVVYRSFLDAINQLPKAKRWDALEAIAAYAMDHEEPDLDRLGVAGSVFLVAKPLVDKNNRRYENGKLGGRPGQKNQTETKPKPNHNQTITKPKPNDNQTKPNHNQTVTKPEPNVNVNDNAYGLDPLKGSKPISRACEAPDGGAPATAAPPSADEIQELKTKLRRKGARG